MEGRAAALAPAHPPWPFGASDQELAGVGSSTTNEPGAAP